MRTVGVLGFSVVMLMGLWAAPSVLVAEEPHRGGILQVALAGDPPSLDMHQEQTFMVAIPLGPVYNNLIVFDPHNYPEIIGDLAESWTVSDDYLTYAFKLQEADDDGTGQPDAATIRDAGFAVNAVDVGVIVAKGVSTGRFLRLVMTAAGTTPSITYTANVGM